MRPHVPLLEKHFAQRPWFRAWSWWCWSSPIFFFPSFISSPPSPTPNLYPSPPPPQPLSNLSSSPSSHPKHAQCFFLFLERIAFSQRKKGGSDERRKISFCPGGKEQDRIHDRKLEYQKQLNWIKEVDKPCSPSCQRGEVSSLTWSSACKGLCLSLDCFKWNKNKPPIQPTFNCLIAVAFKCPPSDFSWFHLSCGADYLVLSITGNVWTWRGFSSGEKNLKTDYYFPEVLWHGLYVEGQKKKKVKFQNIC